MDVREFKAAITNEFALRRIRNAFAKVGLPDAAYSVDRLHISQLPTHLGDCEGSMEFTTDCTRVIINFHMKSPLTREMSLSVCPSGPPMDLNGVMVHTFIGIFLPSKRAGSGEDEKGQLIQLFDS